MKRNFTLCGAGATGKTVVLDYLRNDPNLRILPSPVRAYYEKHHINGEQGFFKLSTSAQLNFQLGLFFQVEQHLQSHLTDDHKGTTITERCLWDHLAYVVHLCPQLSLKLYQDLQSRARFLQSYYELAYFFPYPQSWMNDSSGQDGFRKLTVGKSVQLDAMLRGWLDRYSSYAVIPEASPEQRAIWLRTVLHLTPPESSPHDHSPSPS